MRHRARFVPAGWRPTPNSPAAQAIGVYLGSRALRDETHRGLQAAGVLFETDVLVVVNGDLMLGAEQARCGEG